ncbi:hypothetical protein ATW55_04445 [Ferroacidibacillus organovorans]|uniref:Uncharacterized protein n=1 Tax=Ferroacidibacillus organovorans TaxID=1765683 RepID=A0A101XPR9_9BACL|nr:hypothetical protein ATW55_04445 [Ferroacidibacillus organovorans]
MPNFGNHIQFDVYKTMPHPDPDRLPVVYEEWERRAREVLADEPFYYVSGGAGGERTMRGVQSNTVRTESSYPITVGVKWTARSERLMHCLRSATRFRIAFRC